jgi:hypothetical protein
MQVDKRPPHYALILFALCKLRTQVGLICSTGVTWIELARDVPQPGNSEQFKRPRYL